MCFVPVLNVNVDVPQASLCRLAAVSHAQRPEQVADRAALLQLACDKPAAV